MKTSTLVAVVTVLGLAATGARAAEPRRDAILAALLAQAKKDDARFAGFSAERGAAIYRTSHQGKDGTISCAACHGASPREKGQTKLGKAIEPMAVSSNPARFTDLDNVEKWFRRNCPEVLGRACTAAEKGDFITFLAGQ